MSVNIFFFFPERRNYSYAMLKNTIDIIYKILWKRESLMREINFDRRRYFEKKRIADRIELGPISLSRWIIKCRTMRSIMSRVLLFILRKRS